MEAWQYGPVFPDVYERYKSFGSMYIGTKVFTKDKASLIAPETKELISSALDLCSEYTSSGLVDVSYAQPPWKDAYAQGRGTEITEKNMRDFFCRS